MTLLVISIILVLLLFDHCLVGYFPRLFNLWYPIDTSLGKPLLEESFKASVKLNFSFNVWGYRGNLGRRLCDMRLMLTSKYLAIRNTRLTYVWKIPTEQIKEVEVKKKIFGKSLRFSFQEESKKHFFELISYKSEIWVERLVQAGISKEKIKNI